MAKNFPLVLKLLLTGIFFLPLMSFTDADEVPPAFTLADEITSEDGHVKLTWDMAVANASVEVQQAQDKDFSNAKIIYSGPDNATFISGLEDGTYYFRLRKPESKWSDSIKVSVQHHSLTLAFTLFGLGAVVFLLTVFVVIKGAVQASADNL